MTIKMPRLGVNDDCVLLTKWLVKDGDRVVKNQNVAEIETSKETSEVKAESDGVIHILVNEGEDIEVGSAIAEIGELNDKSRQTAQTSLNDSDAEAELRITDKAKKMALEHGIDLTKLPTDRLIREKDILQLIGEEPVKEEKKYNKVLVYGGGGFGQVAINILQHQHVFDLYGVVDSNYPDRKECFGVQIVGNDEDLERLYKEGYRKIINAVEFLNKSHYRKPPYEKLEGYGFEFYNCIHSSAQIEPSAKLGVGNLVCAGAIIGGEAHVGNNCIINAGSIISHFCKIEDHCHIASGAVLASAVEVGENTLIGQNCTVYSDVKIGKNVTILNGCNVFKDVPDNSIVRNDT